MSFKLILGILFITALSCAGGRKNISRYELAQDPPFTIKDVYAQDWVAGIKEGGSGTNLHITFKTLEEDVVIQELYFRNTVVKAQNSPKDRFEYVGYFKKKMPEDRIMDMDPVKEAQNRPPKAFPFDLTNDEAVVSYLHDGALQFSKIANIRQEKLLAYPSSGPKGDN